MAGMLTFREVLQGLNARSGNLGDLAVAEVMVRDPLTCGPEETSESLRESMANQHVRYVPVMEALLVAGADPEEVSPFPTGAR